MPDFKYIAVYLRQWLKDYPAITDYGILRPRDPLLGTSKAHSEIRNITQDELHLFELKGKIADIESIQQKIKSTDIS